MILAEAFIDESGTHDGSPMMTVAGYLFRHEQARRFSRDWRKVLQKYGLPAAHQTDCATGNGHYSQMDRDERVEITKLLIENIKRRTMIGVGVSVDPVAYDRIVGRENNAPTCYTFALMGVFTLVSRWRERIGQDARISYIFEAGHRSQREANRFIKSVIGSAKPTRLSKGYAGHAFADKRVALELQAADMLAWQYQHNHARRKQGHHKPRMDFQALLRPQDVCIEHSDETLRRWREDIVDGGRLVGRY